MSTFNCNTCHVMCASVEEVKDHYRTDLHVFNSKRRAKNLKPVSAEDFDRLAVPIKNPAIAIVGSASASASSSSKDKMNSTNPSASWNQTLFHRTFNNNSDKVRQEKIALMSVVSINDSKDRMVTDTVTNSNISDSQENINVIKSDKEDDDDDDDNYEDIEDEDEETPMDTKKQLPQLPLGANISIFDNKQFENIELCISHMVVTNGFFIPDSEYISDLEGLLEYLGEKVKLGGMCLYCQKRFSSGRACQHHMIQKSHCKLAYEENVVSIDLVLCFNLYYNINFLFVITIRTWTNTRIFTTFRRPSKTAQTTTRRMQGSRKYLQSANSFCLMDEHLAIVTSDSTTSSTTARRTIDRASWLRSARSC